MSPDHCSGYLEGDVPLEPIVKNYQRQDLERVRHELTNSEGKVKASINMRV